MTANVFYGMVSRMKAEKRSQRNAATTMSDYLGPSRFVCPKCQGHLSRVPRRGIDHLISLIMPVQRYRCRTFACQWEGNLRTDKSAKAPTRK